MGNKKTKAEIEAEKAAKAAAEAAAKLEEQKKTDLTLKEVDNTAINNAAPNAVQTGIKPAEGIVINNHKWTANDMVNNPVGLNNELDAAQQERDRPMTMQDYFKIHKQNAVKDKTDAQRMQQYYALTDVLKTLGQMGGGIVGGAIGGNVMDSMPNVGEYKESRGYINAFENANKAKDRLRDLENQEFQLAMKMDDRSWQQQQAALEREYRSKEQELNRQWQMTFFEYQKKMEDAIAEKNFTRQAELQKELQAIKHANEVELAKVRGDYELKARRISAYSGRGGGNDSNNITLDFENGTSMSVTDDQYRRIRNRFIGGTFGPEEEEITDKNLAVFIRQNPDTIRQFLGTPATTTNGGTNNTNTPAPAPTSGNTDNTKNNKKDKKNKGKKDNEPDTSKWEI